MKKYRNHGMINRNEIDFYGENFRLQPLQAIVASNQLKKLDKVIKIRNNNAKLLDEKLCHTIITESLDYAEKYGWKTKRHDLYPTTDNQINSNWSIYNKILVMFIPINYLSEKKKKRRKMNGFHESTMLFPY